MKKFLIKISILVFSIFLIFFLKILYINDWQIIFKRFENTQFNNNLKSFNQLIVNKKKINLILGSSLAFDAFKPEDWSKKNWVKFTNKAQNIFESYLFLNHYREEIKIDTILIVIQPFDFRDDINKNFNINSNGNFKIFRQGHDRKNYNRSFFTENMQSFLNANFYSIENLINSLSSKANEKRPPSEVEFRQLYFMNVQNPPKIDAFKEFDSLAKRLGIEIFYILTPKENRYLDAIIINEKNNLAWNHVISYILKSEGNLINLEYEFYNQNEYFANETHLNEKGAKVFTKIIKKRLRD